MTSTPDASGASRPSRPGRTRAATVLLTVGALVAVAVPATWWATRQPQSQGESLSSPPPSPAIPMGSATPTTSPTADVTPGGPAPTGALDGATRAASPTRAAAPDAPRRLILPRQKVNAPVDPVGVDDQGLMELPEDVDRVGWYRYGPAPGSDRGSAVIAGHVDSAEQGLGALAALSSVRTGDVIQVQLRSSTTLSYRVVGITRLRKQVLPTREIFAREGAPRLTVVTCGGPFDRARRSYRDNLVIRAEPLP
ncbi:MAG: sortase [Kineosporiaceae bacterium]